MGLRFVIILLMDLHRKFLGPTIAHLSFELGHGPEVEGKNSHSYVWGLCLSFLSIQEDDIDGVRGLYLF